MKEKKRYEEKIKEKLIKCGCNTICKAVHIKLIYVLVISTQYI